MVFSLFFHSWTCSSLCFYTLLQGRKSLLWKVIRSPLSTDTPKRFFNCKKFRHIWFWSKIYRFRPCILLTRKGLKWNINKSHAIKKKAINGSWFTNFDKRLIVILEEEKRIKEAYKRWTEFPVGRLLQIAQFILLHEKLLQFDWLRAVVFQLNLKYLHVKITNLLRVVV